MANLLAKETSPYLLQHKDNPVNWYPWGDEAFEKARQENVPIFLSVGYSACHWCHVMAHESFEDDETAAILNEHFVCIKVDREERPDVDAIYMNAVQAISGRGGWPMSVWLLPDGRPFYGGTYYPLEARHGMPSFKQVLNRIREAYVENRDAIERDAANLTQAVSGRIQLDQTEEIPLTLDTLNQAFQVLAQHYDKANGGFSGAPKFPPAMTLELLMRMYQREGWQHALEMVTYTLDRMAWGGMYDQVGGGFHRYSVDERWLVPHFEKMLYDNALLIRAYLYAYQITGTERYRQVVEEIIDYVRREMTDTSGGFYSAQDADSEGEEGKFFIWTEHELQEQLPEKINREAVLDYWGLKQGVNFEGQNILWVPDAPVSVAQRHDMTLDNLLKQVAQAKTVLLAVRDKRIKPGLDDKILAAWNGLLIKSLAQAGRALKRSDFVEMAVNAADFIVKDMKPDGRLKRSYKGGQARFDAYLEDYAFVAEGLIEVYQATFDLKWYREALELTEQMVDLFWDEDAGFYDTARDHEALIVRPQDVTDNAIPAGTSGAVAVLLRMAILADRSDWRAKAERILQRLTSAIETYPSAFGYLGSQLDFAARDVHEIALIGDTEDGAMQELLNEVNTDYRPNHIVALRSEDDLTAGEMIPLLANRELVDGKAAAYVCRNYVCKLPATSVEMLRQQLSEELD